MSADHGRIASIGRVLARERLDALVAFAPPDVLLLSGYWPVVGLSLALVTREGQVGLVVPEDERELAASGWASEVRTFLPGSLDYLTSPVDLIRAPLTEIGGICNLSRGCVLGYERGNVFTPASYVSMNRYGPSVRDLLTSALPHVTLRPSGELLARMRAVLTDPFVDRVREACQIAAACYATAARCMRPGMREWEVANLFASGLNVGTGMARRGGSMFCMSGPNSAQAKSAFQLTASRRIEEGDFVLVHCNSYCDGMWTDITRTFTIGRPDERKRELYDAVLAASSAAMQMVRPGAPACEVDRCAREVMTARGFGAAFAHATGHGVGFAAIDHNALPRLHPKSQDVLEPGMVFNIEPAAYFDGWGGIRHCDVVAVREDGFELLTPFQSTVDDLTISA